MFFSTLREAVRRRREAELDRDFWKQKALDAEAKLEKRSDFFIDREMRIFDRFLTAKVKTHAITDEIKAKQADTEDYEAHALEAYLQDTKDFLVQCAKEAGAENPEDTAARTFEANRSQYVIDFQQQQRIN